MWWIDVIIVAVVLLGAYGFVSVVRRQTDWFSRRSNNLRAEDLYGGYADPPAPRGRRLGRDAGKRSPRPDQDQ